MIFLTNKLKTIERTDIVINAIPVNTRVIDGVYTPEEHEIDWLKTGVFLIIALIPISLIIWFYSILPIIMAAVIILSSIAFMNYWSKADCVIVGGHEFWKNKIDTHDLVYEIWIKPTKWQRHITIGNTMNC